MNCYEKSSLISIGFIPNLLVVAEAKAGFLQLAVLLVLVVAWSCCKWLWCFLAEKEEILSWLRPLGESIRPLGEESDISPEVDEVTVVLVVSLVLREAEPPAEPVPRKTPSKTSSGAARRAWLGRPSPQSESESDESPVKGTERIWLALWKKEEEKRIVTKSNATSLRILNTLCSVHVIQMQPISISLNYNSDQNPSFVYCWSISHTLEYEFFCLGSLGRSGW